VTAVDAPDTPFPPAPVEELLRLFGKAVRAHQLYLPNNPVYKSSIDAVRAAFEPIWRETDELPLRFTEGAVNWYGRPVLADATRSADNLAWTFFKDGIREITFTRGFEEAELVRLFEILARLRKAAPEEDDLLTMLWEADFGSLRYRYVDIGADPTAPLGDGGAPPSAAPSADGIASAAREPLDESRPGIINLQDFDATLYFLDEKELDYLRKEIEREYTSDLRQNVLSILFDIYEAQAVAPVRDEIASLLESMMVMMLAAGQLRAVAYLLSESQVVVARAGSLTAEQRDRLVNLRDRLSAPEALGQLLQALDESADLPSREALAALFEELRPAALETVFAWLHKARTDAVRALVTGAAERLVASHPGELGKLIASKHIDVAKEAVKRSGAMKAQGSVPALARLLVESGDAPLRLAAVQALTQIDSPGAMQALERSIEDQDRDVRVAVCRALGAKAYRGVLPRIESRIKGKPIRTADLTERTALFEAYGSMCGDAGISYLDDLLNGKGMFGMREEPEIRACAAIALGRIGSRKAQDALRKAAGEKDIVVRNAITRALRGGQS
jgi:HEAT repeat protein